jgi:hypothetical protein
MLVAAGAFASMGPAHAEPFSSAQLQAVAPGGEFRGFITANRGFENHIWRFALNGTVTAIANLNRATGNLGPIQEIGDVGTWRIEGNRLCVEWQGLNRQYSGCYTVDGSAVSSQVRLTGPATWQGTLSR